MRSFSFGVLSSIRILAAIIVLIALFSVLEHLPQLVLHCGCYKRRAQDSGHEIKQSRLRRVEVVHDDQCCDQPDDVADHSHVEVKLRELCRRFAREFRFNGGASLLVNHPFVRCLAGVEAQQQRNEKAGHDDVPEAEHGKLCVRVVCSECLGKYKLNWRVDVAGDSDHDGRAKNKENIIEKQQRQQDSASSHRSDAELFDALDGKRDAQKIICTPVLCRQIPAADCARKHERRKLERRGEDSNAVNEA